jgi:hypothetical protein
MVVLANNLAGAQPYEQAKQTKKGQRQQGNFLHNRGSHYRCFRRHTKISRG